MLYDLMTPLKRVFKRPAKLIPAIAVGGAGYDYPLWRAYAYPLKGQVRVQMDRITYHYMCAFTGINCPDCALPIQQCVWEGHTPFCTVCDSFKPKRETMCGSWMTSRDRDFDADDTAEIALYLNELCGLAEANNDFERARFAHITLLSSLARELKASRSRSRVTLLVRDYGSWAKLISDDQVVRTLPLTGGSYQATTEDWAQDRAIIETLQDEAIAANDRLMLVAAENAACVRAAADAHADAVVTARGINASAAARS
jgi:hypothetical protein